MMLMMKQKSPPTPYLKLFCFTLETLLCLLLLLLFQKLNFMQVVRLGHPARLLSAVQEHSLDALLSNSEGTAIVRDVRKDIDETLVGQKYIVSLALNHVD